jgi:TRAP-type C4-dicarboxylate transport system permease small subunit
VSRLGAFFLVSGRVGGAMAVGFRRAMDALYLLCVGIAGVCLVLISAVIPWSVFTRYVLNQAASWPEPMAILLTIVLTFFGAAACYRINLHMNMTIMTEHLSARGRWVCEIASELLMAATGLFMVIWGALLCETTWYQTIAEFPFLSVGVTYLPIPIGGLFLLLFVIERLAIGRPPPGWADEDGAVEIE